MWAGGGWARRPCLPRTLLAARLRRLELVNTRRALGRGCDQLAGCVQGLLLWPSGLSSTRTADAGLSARPPQARPPGTLVPCSHRDLRAHAGSWPYRVAGAVTRRARSVTTSGRRNRRGRWPLLARGPPGKQASQAVGPPGRTGVMPDQRLRQFLAHTDSVLALLVSVLFLVQGCSLNGNTAGKIPDVTPSSKGSAGAPVSGAPRAGSSLVIKWGPRASGALGRDAPEITRALASAAPILRPLVPQAVHLEVTDARIEGSSGLLYGTERADVNDSVVPTEGLILILSKATRGTWKVVPEGSPEFCHAISLLPPGLMNTSFRSHFLGC